MTIVYVKQNDTKPDLQVTVKDANDDAIPVDGATIEFQMSSLDGTNKISSAGSIVTPASGIIKYIWATGDLDTVGDYNASFQITFSDSTILTVPSKGYMKIIVQKELS